MITAASINQSGLEVIEFQEFQGEQSIPFILFRQSIQKITAVGFATFAIFRYQKRWNLNNSLAISVSCSLLTLLAQKFSSNTELKKGWFDPSEMSFEKLRKMAVTSIKGQIIWGIIFYAFFGESYRDLAAHIRKQKIGFFLRVIFVMPVAQEIFYRGFIKERAEDACSLLNRFVVSIKTETQKKISNIVQALFDLSNYYHLHGIPSLYDAIFGYLYFSAAISWGEKKDLNNSMVNRMCSRVTSMYVYILRLLIVGR